MTKTPEKPEDTAQDGAAAPPPVLREPFLVLIVDDDEPITETLELIVLDAGYSAMTAPHGRAALELARQRWPALVLTDLMMPYLPGDALIAALRKEAAASEWPVPKIVLLTAAGQRAAKAAGADRVISKPFDIAVIDAILLEMLGPPPPT